MTDKLYSIDKVPNSYKEYYNLNQENFNSKIDLELEEKYMNYINDICEKNQIDINLYMNYVVMKLIISEKMKNETNFDFGMPYFDIELYLEDELSDLIENNKILIFDEKIDKKAVMLPVKEYEFLKSFEKEEEEEEEEIAYYEKLLENYEKTPS